MSKNGEFVTRMEKQMTRWEKEVAALAVLGGQASGRAQVAYLAAMKELEASREAAQKTFQEVRFASEDTGVQLRAGMQQAWVAMQEALEKATAGLRK